MIGCRARAGLGITALAFLWGSSAGFAEAPVTVLQHLPAELAQSATTFAADLAFPTTAEAEDQLTVPRMAFLKPPGDGPFPALVILHQCGGVNDAVAGWARDATRRGYAVLLVDSLRPRQVRSVCYGPRNGVNLFRGARDVFQAADHLRKFSFVDPVRVSMVGFSWGAMVGLIAASARYADALQGRRFASVTSFYPGCFHVARPNAAEFDIASDDMRQPVLALMGERDNETPADECVTKFEAARRAGSAVAWHVYPDAGHCWDCKQLDGLSKVDVRGNTVSYHYRSDITQDSAQRLFAFLAQVAATSP